MRFVIAARARWIALVVAVGGLAAGGIAWAAIPDSNGVIHGCYQSSSGTLRVIGTNPTVGGGRCTGSEIALNWNQTGPAGPAGADGKDGEDGEDGDPFSGTFTSPNGEYSLSVTDAGITLAGAGSTILLDAGGIQVDSAAALTLRSAGLLALLTGSTMLLAAETQLAMQSSGSASLIAVGTLRLGALAGCSPAARLGDAIVGTAAADGSVTGVVNGGSSVVCIG